MSEVQLKNREAIVIATARKLKVSEDKVWAVIRHYEGQLRGYLTNPLTSKKGITLRNGLRFFIKPEILKGFLYSAEEKGEGRLEKEKEFTRKLIKQVTNG